MKIDRCHTLVPFRQGLVEDDHSGCLKYCAHNDSHISLLKDGRFLEWEDDYDCTCGCWNDENDLINVCKNYSFLTKAQAIERIAVKFGGAIPDEVMSAINEDDEVRRTGDGFTLNMD